MFSFVSCVCADCLWHVPIPFVNSYSYPEVLTFFVILQRLAVEIMVSGFVFDEQDFRKPWEGKNDNMERYGICAVTFVPTLKVASLVKHFRDFLDVTW